MSAPFIFIATNRLKDGKLAAERDRAADLSSFIEASEPQLLAFNEPKTARNHLHERLRPRAGARS